MDITVTTENARVPVSVLHIHGNLDSSTYEAFLAQAEALIDGGAHHLLIDIGHTAHISSAGLRAFHSLFNKLRALHPDEDLSEDEVMQGIKAGTYHSPHLKLVNMSEAIKAVFEMTGFDMYIETYDDVKQALASF